MALGHHPIAFPKLDDAQIAALGKFATLKSFHVGEKLFAEGEPGEDWWWCYPDELFMK